MNQIWQYITENKEAIGVTCGVLFELIVRLIPTAKDWSIINIAKKLFDIIPNKAAGGGVHNEMGKEEQPGGEVTLSKGSTPGTSSLPIIALLVGLTCLGCSHKAYPVATTVTKDSVTTRIETQLKDTTIFIPGAEILIHDSIPCPEFTLSKTVTKDNLTAAVNIRNGKINVDCKADSLKERISWLENQLFSFSKHIEIQKIPVPGPVSIKYKTPAWCWWMVAIVIIYLVIKFHTALGSFAGWAADTIMKWRGK